MRIFKVPAESSKQILSLSVNHKSKYLASGGNDGQVKIWNIENFDQVAGTNEPTKELVDNVKPLKTLTYHQENLESVAQDSKKEEEDKGVPPQTANYDKETNVNIVKFSSIDDWLITGDSNGKVYLIEAPWEDNLKTKPELIIDLYAKNATEMLKNDAINITQRSELDDEDAIMDIAWSNDGRLIAIASLNNKVLLYDFKHRKFVTVLSDFTAAVKSISFDPTNNYLTVISNSKIVHFYQYKFKELIPGDERFYIKQINTVTKLLQKSMLTTRFNRFNWSPNGNLLAIPNGTKEMGKSLNPSNNGKTSTVINFNPTNFNNTYSLNNITVVALLSPLNNFKTICSFVGHKFSSLETISFNPQLFKIKELADNDPSNNTPAPSNKELNEEIKNNRYYSIVATGGLDKTLVIWSTIIEKPIFIGKDFSNNTIIDIEWTKDGQGLFVGSLDGSLNFLKFDENELGLKSSPAELTESLKEVSKSVKLLEDPNDWKKVTDEHKKAKAASEIQQKDNEEAKQKHTAQEKLKLENKTKDESKILKKEEQSDKTKKDASKRVQPTPVTKKTSTLKSATITKSGKKRVAPLLVSSYGNGNSSSASKPATILQSNISTTTNEFDKPSNIVSKGITTFNAKRQRELDPDQEESKIKKQRSNTNFEPIEFLNTTIINPATAFARLRLAIPKAALTINHQSPVDSSFMLIVKNGSGNEQKPTRVSLEKELNFNSSSNNFQNRVSTLSSNALVGDAIGGVASSATNGRSASAAAVSSSVAPAAASARANSNGLLPNDTAKKEIFVDFIPKLVNLVAGGERGFWALGTLDGTVIIYSNSGKRIFPPIVLGSALSFLECKNNYLMAVTSIGELYVWNVNERKIHFKPVNIYTLFEPFNKYQDELIVKGDSMTLCSINAKGIPLITLSNGNGYLYDKDMGSWCIISDSWWAFGSHYWDAAAITPPAQSQAHSSDTTGDDNNANNPLSTILSHKNRSSVISLIESKTNEEIFKKRKTNLLKKISKIMLMKHGYENLEISISLAHLENKILIAEKLQEHDEFKRLLLSYCIRISELVYKSRLTEVFQDLLGPRYHAGDDWMDDDESSTDEDGDSEDMKLDTNNAQFNNQLYTKGAASANSKKAAGSGCNAKEESEKAGWNPTICGFNKHELLKEIILACAKYREVQRILVQYGKAIGLLNSDIIKA